MKTGIRVVSLWVVAAVMVLGAAATANAESHRGHDGGRGRDRDRDRGRHEDRREPRHEDRHHDRYDRPIAELALCILYPARCRPRPVIVNPDPVIIVQQQTVVVAPPVEDPGKIVIDGGISQYGGSWWDRLPQHTRLQFVSSYVQAHKGTEAEMFRGKSYGDFVRGLNELYRSEQNRSLSIDMALDVVTLNLNGYLQYGDCMNGYYIMTSSPKLFTPEMANAKFDECSKYRRPDSQ